MRGKSDGWARATRAPLTTVYKSRSGLIGSAVGLIRAALKDEDWPLLRSYLRQLRARGLADDELSRVYGILRARHHRSAPTLEELDEAG
jgi:hypothetical protein